MSQPYPLPAGWCWSPLAELLTGIETGKSFKCEERPPTVGEIGVIKVSAVSWGEFQELESKTCTDAERVNPALFVQRGDFLFSRANTIELVGACVIAQQVTLHTMLSDKILRFRFRTEAMKTWALHLLRSKQGRQQIEALSSGNQDSMRNIGQERIGQIQVPVPPAAEQTRIVAKLEDLLSDLDAGVAELKAAQQKLQRYRQSLLKAAVEGSLTATWREANPAPEETGADLLTRILRERRARWEARQLAKFEAQGKRPPSGWREQYVEPVRPEVDSLPALPPGWKWASLEQVAADEKYSLAIGPFGSNLTVPDYRDDGVPLVFVRNIRAGQFGGQTTRYVTPEKARGLAAHEVVAGDVLVTKMGEPPGDARVYPVDQPPAIITADCIKVRCTQGLMLPKFLEAVVNSHIGREQIKPMTQGVAQKKVSLGRFSKLAVPIPPAQEQTAILVRLGEAEREARSLAIALAKALSQSTAQRQNLLRAAFAGQLVPQDPADEPAAELLARICAERATAGGGAKARSRRAPKEAS